MVTSSKQLFDKINAANAAGRLKLSALAAEAGVSLTSLCTMLEPGWENRGVANVEAIAAAYERMKAKRTPARRDRAKATTRGR